MIPTCTVDVSSLNEALDEAMYFSSRTPQLCVDSAAYAVADRAYELTPAVTVSKIDADLGTIVTVKVGKRGKPLSARYSKNVMKSGGRMGDIVRNVPLSVLIIAAQAKPGSNYNLLTGHRWMRPANPFAGVNRAAGRAAMRAAENRLINARHSSTGFLRLGWVTVKRLLRAGFYGGPPPTDGDEGAGTIDFGTTYSESAPGLVSRTIENLVGNVPGMVGNNAPNYQRALIEKGEGPLQQAVDEVAAEKMDYVFEKELALLERRVSAIR
jgi:hypothetical protein